MAKAKSAKKAVLSESDLRLAASIGVGKAVMAALKGAGFALQNTGGNTYVFMRDDDDDGIVYLGGPGGEAPEKMSDPVVIQFSANGSPLLTLEFASVRSFVAAVVQG